MGSYAINICNKRFSSVPHISNFIFVKIIYNLNYIVSSTQLFKGYSAKNKTQYLIFNIPSLLKSYFTDIVPLTFMMLSIVHIFLIKMCYLFLNSLYILSFGLLVLIVFVLIEVA